MFKKRFTTLKIHNRHVTSNNNDGTDRVRAVLPNEVVDYDIIGLKLRAGVIPADYLFTS